MGLYRLNKALLTTNKADHQAAKQLSAQELRMGAVIHREGVGARCLRGPD